MNYYLLGLYLGDGFISVDRVRVTDGSNYYKFSVICSDYNFDEVKSLIPRVFCDYHRTCKDGAYEYYSLCTKQQDFLLQFLPYGRRCGDKRIPQGLSREDFFELLSGLIDSDGTLDSESFNFLSTTIELIQGVASYLDKFGIEYTITHRVDKRGYKTVHCLRFSATTLNKMDLHLRVSYKQERLELLKKKSRGKLIKVSQDWIESNKEALEKLMPKSSFYKLCKGQKQGVRENIYEQIEGNLG